MSYWYFTLMSCAVVVLALILVRRWADRQVEKARQEFNELAAGMDQFKNRKQ